MPIIECPECHNEISSDASACPHCGCTSSLPAYSGDKPILVKHVAVALVITVIAIAIMKYTSGFGFMDSGTITIVSVILAFVLTKVFARLF